MFTHLPRAHYRLEYLVPKIGPGEVLVRIWGRESAPAPNALSAPLWGDELRADTVSPYHPRSRICQESSRYEGAGENMAEPAD